MKHNTKVRINIKNFRAINTAEIKLDGITVISGVNGCGKSTISKLLYWAYRGATDYQVLADIQLESDMKNLYKIVEIFNHSINTSILKDSEDSNDLKFKAKCVAGVAELMTVMVDWFELKNSNFTQYEIVAFLNKLKEKLKEIGIDEKHYDVMRFINIFDDIFKNKNELKKQISILGKEIEFSKIDTFDFLIGFVNYIFSTHQKNIISRPKIFLDDKIQDIFHISTLPEKLEILEEQSPIYMSNHDYIGIPYWIDNVIYIDTPMFFQNSGTDHWEDVNKKLTKKSSLDVKNVNISPEIDELIKREILTGQAEIKFDELSETFVFKTPSGAEIDLSDSATGIKAFAVINLLLKNKSINDKTLLILDEPEAHLHPQWIIEFGRLLTFIHKYIGAKVLVATHSPDMVQALRYIPNKEGMSEHVNFYLAEITDNNQFNYRDLHGEIDDIFTSFNISLDKLEKYGED